MEDMAYNEHDDERLYAHRKKRFEYLKARRDFRKAQIMMHRLRFFIRVFSIIFLIWLISVVIKLPQWYLDSAVFSRYPNSSLVIEGNNIISNAQIMTSLKGIKLPNKPIYLIDTEPIRKTLLKLTPIKKVYIRRFGFPARMKIVIEEKKLILAVAPNPKVPPIAFFTDDASLIGREYIPKKAIQNTYLVLSYDDYYKWSTKHVKYLVYLSKTLEGYSGERVLYLDMREPDDVFIQLQSMRLRIGELNSTVFRRTKRITSVMPQAKNLKGKIDYVDLRWDNSTFIKLKNNEKFTPTLINVGESN